MLLESKMGEVKTVEAWEDEVDEFWRGVSRDVSIKKPLDAFQRYSRILGLKEVKEL